MWKSKKFIVITASVAVLLIVALVGSTAGAVLAQDGDERQGRRGALMARVAEILNIDQQDLESAFKQAQGELREQAIDDRLQELIDDGTLTEEQADEFREWIEARPDVPRVGPRRLQQMVDEGVVTQEQMDELKEWMESRPDVPMIGHKRFGHKGPGSSPAQ